MWWCITCVSLMCPALHLSPSGIHLLWCPHLRQQGVIQFPGLLGLLQPRSLCSQYRQILAVANIWSWCPASHQSLGDPAWPSNTHGRALLPHTMLNIEIWCFEAITSTLYLLSTGRIPSGTGRMGPRSMSVGPSIGGRSDLPPGPIWKRCSID